MDEDALDEAAYDAVGVGQLETIWGEGFLSPGGAAEVSRIVEGVDLAGADVLDIGCGTGGAAFVLAEEHGAGSVIGTDIEPYVINEATARAASRGVSDRVRFVHMESGSLPFPDRSFDVVFSKDAIILVEDKVAIYTEALRVLRPGGWLCVGDWFRGDGPELDAAVTAFSDRSGEEFFMQSLRETGELVTSIGFVDPTFVDRCDWYHAEAVSELERVRGPLRDAFLANLGEDVHNGTLEFWADLVAATRDGVLRPGHLRARAPRTDA